MEKNQESAIFQIREMIHMEKFFGIDKKSQDIAYFQSIVNDSITADISSVR